MSVIDRAALDRLGELIGGDRDALAELVRTFQEEGDEIVAELDGALGTRDATVLRRGAHSLKSSAQDFGASELARRAAALEWRATNGWPDEAADEVAGVRSAFASARDGLASWLAENAG